MASDFYDAFNQKLAQEVPVQTGIFGADMQVELVNNGPVTIILDTKKSRFGSFIYHKILQKKSVLDMLGEVSFQALADAIGRDEMS